MQRRNRDGKRTAQAAEEMREHVAATEGISWRIRELALPVSSLGGHPLGERERYVEAFIERDGCIPERVILAASAATPECLRELAAKGPELPRLTVARDRGAVDIRLESRDGAQVKTGVVALENQAGKQEIPMDPVTRRFRLGDLAPGKYTVHAAAAEAGGGKMAIAVRAGDVARLALPLDGRRATGTTTVHFAIEGTKARRVRLHATDTYTGQVVFDKEVVIKRGVATATLPIGGHHWNIEDGSARSCYDSDDTGIFIDIRPPRRVNLRIPVPEPDPFVGPFGYLPAEFGSVARVLPQLGIRSIEELANVEPEALLHRAQTLGVQKENPVDRVLYARSVDAARAFFGRAGVAGELRSELRLAKGASFERSYLLQEGGTAEFNVALGSGQRGELVIEGPHGVTRRKFTNATTMKLEVSGDAARAEPFKITVKNLAAGATSGELIAKLPTDRAGAIIGYRRPTVWENVETILKSWAQKNPGVSSHIPEAIQNPMNIRMWLDRARALMEQAGVCSVDDLGPFRLDPGRVLQPGIYMAPAAGTLAPIHPLKHYIFAGRLSANILHYKPNDVSHETAIVLAGEWDLTVLPPFIIGAEVRELVVIARSIKHDANSLITWQQPELPPAGIYWPETAPAGPDGREADDHGKDGDPGDPNPPPSKNGGANAVIEGPTVTMYIFDTTRNLPPIILRGQNGGFGGHGQNGGNGGNGVAGPNAEGTFFGGCCRGQGWGSNGGKGGDGGRGGKGGDGGRGGRLTLLTNPASIAVLAAAAPSIDVNPGKGGGGGWEGNPGFGGKGGPAGSADCEMWCASHPERVGTDGANGVVGQRGWPGHDGPKPLPDALQTLPISLEQWTEVFNRPHILGLEVNYPAGVGCEPLPPSSAEPGHTVIVNGRNFDPAHDQVFFDGTVVGTVESAVRASFVVPMDVEGGLHPVVIRPPGVTDSLTGRRSNRAMLSIVPVVIALPPNTRWAGNTQITVKGLAFRPGLQLSVEDRSVPAPYPSYNLPVSGVTREEIHFNLPTGALGSLRGVRRIRVRNPDGGRNRICDDTVVRISDATIVMNCVAHRVVGTMPGSGTTRSATDIANLFVEGGPDSLNLIWAQAGIVFQLSQPVRVITYPDPKRVALWPDLEPKDQKAMDLDLFQNHGGVPGALNFFFFQEVEGAALAYAWQGQASIMIVGDEAGITTELAQATAHEAGHAICLPHTCLKPGEDAGKVTLLGRACMAGDESNLMYPYADGGEALEAVQIAKARIGATYVEAGKIKTGTPLDGVDRCGAPDTTS